MNYPHAWLRPPWLPGGIEHRNPAVCQSCGIHRRSETAKDPCPEPYQPNPFTRCDPLYQFQHMFPTIRGDCALCGYKLPKGRRRWCSDECGQEAASRFYIRKGDSNAVRRAILKRDAGVCHECGLFCEVQTYGYQDHPLWRHALPHEPAKWDWRCPLLGWMGWTEPLPWEAHHLVAVTEGGGGCDLDGYVTLCMTCHGPHTGALRKRLNRAKRPQMELGIA